MALFRKKIPVIPFHGDLKTPLLSLGGRDQFLLDDAARGVLVLGGTGSGKTSGSGRALAMAYLKAGMGGLVLCAKPDEAANWRAYAKAAGREQDIIEINETAEKRFNFLDYALATIAKEGFEGNLLAVIDTITEAANASSGESDGENRFFRENAREMVGHVIALLTAVYGRLTIKEIVAFIDSAANSREETDSEQWHKESFAARTLGFATLLMDEKPDLEVHAEYWFGRFVDFSDRTRSSIVATFTSTVYPFLTGKLRELFCSDTNMVPELTHNGAIIIANLPIKTFGQTGEVAQKIIKYLWQISVESRTAEGKKALRPVFMFADECQFFVTSYDAEFFSTARSARACGVYLTQDLPSFYSRLAGKGGEHDADALIGKFQTRIFHSNVDKTTNLAAAEMIGKVTKQQASRQQNVSRNRGEGGAYQPHDVAQSDNSGLGRSSSETLSTYQDYAVPPEYFTDQLRNGTKANRFKVDGIVVTGGKTWKHSRSNFIKAEFDQRK